MTFVLQNIWNFPLQPWVNYLHYWSTTKTLHLLGELVDRRALSGPLLGHHCQHLRFSVSVPERYAPTHLHRFKPQRRNLRIVVAMNPGWQLLLLESSLTSRRRSSRLLSISLQNLNTLIMFLPRNGQHWREARTHQWRWISLGRTWRCFLVSIICINIRILLLHALILILQ